MNEVKIYADSYQARFINQEDFLDFLRGIVRRSFWDRKKTKNLRLISMDEGCRLSEELKDRYTCDGLDVEIITDTIQNTGLILKVKNQYYPVRDCAIRTILDRAGISGPALRKVGKDVYARILNDCLKVANGEALLRISEGKVSAVLGGDGHEYAILDMEQIFRRSVEYLNAEFKGTSYLGGFYEHHMVSAMWELSGEDGLLDAYCEELKLHDKEPAEMTPVIRITTSDTGASGANIYPMLLSGSRNDTIALGSPLRLEHKAGATMAKFEEQLGMLYGKYQLAIGKLANLLNIDVQNTVNCMAGIMKRLGIPKRHGMEAVELFKAQHGEEPCTAHDIYYGISEILYMLACNGKDGSVIAGMEETIARALSANWTEYDIPGEFRW
jgi:hypothetical protein